MTIWYRASRLNNPSVVFSGDGGLFTAGRWNHLGRKAIYCSDSLALCTLEWLALHGLSLSGFNYYRYTITLPNDLIVKFTTNDLPPDWNITPATDISRDFAEKELFTSTKHLAMSVPSVIIPEEFNLIINPLHREFLKVAKTCKLIGEYTAPLRTLP